MKKISLLSIVFLSSLPLSGCMHRAPSLKMLEVRADYEGNEQREAAGIRLGSNKTLSEVVDGVPVRTPPQLADIWIFPEEVAQKSYFWGAWVTVEVDGGKWELNGTDRKNQEKPKLSGKQKTALNVKAPERKS